MKHLAILALAFTTTFALAATPPAPAASAVPLQPAKVLIQADPAVKVIVLKNKTNVSKQISIVVNQQDVVTTAPLPPVVVPPAPPASAPVPPAPPASAPIDMHAGIHVDTSTPWPALATTSQILLTQETPPPLRNDPNDFEDGAFRTLCNFVKQGYDDPIVYPGQPGMAHHHTFYGNSAIDAFTTVDNIRTKGETSCRGGVINMSAYWVPSLIDTVTHKPVNPGQMIVYYKTGFATWMVDHITNPIRPLPHGLRMIAGNPKGVNPNPDVVTDCWVAATGDQVPGSAGNAIMPCAPGNMLRVTISFPQCWDGVNLDSPDHKSHMANPIGVAVVDGRNQICPPGYPVTIPRVGFLISWLVPPGADTTKWRFSSDGYDPAQPGGYSFHGDYFEGWEPAISDFWGQKCMVERRECGSFDLGDGRTGQGWNGN